MFAMTLDQPVTLYNGSVLCFDGETEFSSCCALKKGEGALRLCEQCFFIDRSAARAIRPCAWYPVVRC